MIASTAGMVFGIYSVTVCVLLLYGKIRDIFTEMQIFKNISKQEIIIYSIMLIAGFVAIILVFNKTEAFYGTEHDYDVIYTSDSPYLVKSNVYMDIHNPENDIRQPLFAVFAAPFMGIPYLLGRGICGSAVARAIALNFAQMIMLFIGNYLLASGMQLTKAKRICFMVISFCTYTQLLFMLMMEQYIVSFFWLMLCVCQICKQKKLDPLLLWGSGGTLLPSMILIPAVSQKHPMKQLKAWIREMLQCCLGFLLLMMVFCRFAVLYRLADSISRLTGFRGEKITIAEKVCQYTEFIKNCFVRPVAGADLAAGEHISWQQLPVTALNWVGIGILVLCLVSFIWNWKNRSSRVAAFWVAFSAVMLLILGWGTAENGLILYALDFGWAFLVLLFQLVEKLEGVLHIRHLTVICSIAAAAGLLYVNIPAIWDMIRFAIEYYPI